MRSKSNSTQTTKDLEEAFWRLYRDKPLNKITIGQICETAGYNRGTFYLHFQDIYGVLESIEHELLCDMADCVEECMKHLKRDTSKLSLLSACKDVVLYYERNKGRIAVLLSENGDPSFTFRLKERLKPLWREYIIPPNPTRSNDEIELVLEYTLSGVLFMISKWLSNKGSVTTWQMAHLIYDCSIKDVESRFES